MQHILHPPNTRLFNRVFKLENVQITRVCAALNTHKHKYLYEISFCHLNLI